MNPAAYPQCLAALKKARAYLLLDAESLRDSITLPDGSIPDPDDAAILRETVALLDECDTAIHAAEGEQ